MKALSFTFILAGVVIAVIAGLVIEWLNRMLLSPTCDPNTVSFRRAVAGGPGGYVYGSGANPADGWGSFNENSQASIYGAGDGSRAASAYGGGAPVTNFRAYQRIGAAEVPTT